MRRKISKYSAGVAGALALSLALSLAATAQASNYEYPYLYKDPRALGMGGASVAVGGSTRAIFSNPAGLATVPLGFNADLLPLQIGVGNNVRGFADDMSDALDIEDDDEQREAVNQVLRDYRGKNLHFDTSLFPNLNWRGDLFHQEVSFGAGYLATARFDATAHQGMGSEGLLSVNAAGIHGPVFGAGYEWEQFRFGASVKLLTMHSIRERYGVSDIIERNDDDSDVDFSDDAVDGSAVGFDLGVIYQVLPWHPLRPSVGFSLLNVGDMDFGDAGKMPMTANIGAAIHPELPWIAGLTLALDYVDIFNAYDEDSDILKRLHMGVEALLWSNRWSDLALRTGLHQGHFTAGAELRLTAVSLGFVTYAEEVGAYGRQDGDRRYMATLAIGW